MLFFVDETWQKVGDYRVGALGAVALPAAKYNAFCREVYAIKKTWLNATEFTDSEFKGQDCFAKSVFRRQEAHGDSYWYGASGEMFDALEKYGASCFVIWTRNDELLTLRNPHSTALSKIYKGLLYDMRAYMANEGVGRLATLNFDQRQPRDDEASARAVSNFLVRTSGRVHNRWDRFFITVPSFTSSSISPGLQAADMISYLGAHRSDATVRPELRPFSERMLSLRYEYGRKRRDRMQRVRCCRQVM